MTLHIEHGTRTGEHVAVVERSALRRDPGPLRSRRDALAQRAHVHAVVEDHINALSEAIESLRGASGQLANWGAVLGQRLLEGHRLLAAGNGGSAAEAQHLTAELVGRFDGERSAFSAIPLTADSSSVTAISNDYGYDDVFARQVTAHGRPGDILVLLSTSGRSANLLRACEAARAAGLTIWAMTGGEHSPLSAAADECIVLSGRSPSIQEAQLVAVHALCTAFDDYVHRCREVAQCG